MAMVAEATPIWSLISGRGRYVDISDDGKMVLANSAGDVYTGDGKSWMKVPGSARVVSIGADGDMWCVNKEDKIYHWSQAENKWVHISGAATHISVGNKDHVVVVNREGNVYLRGGDKWKQLPGKLRNATIGYDGELWGVNEDQNIYRYLQPENKWDKQPGRGSQTAVVRYGSVYHINNEGRLFHMKNNDGKWMSHPGLLSQISTNSHGVLVGVSDDHKIYLRGAVEHDKNPEHKVLPAIASPKYIVEAPISAMEAMKIKEESSSSLPMSLIGNHVSFKTHQNKYLCAEEDGKLVADRAAAKSWEHFLVIGIDTKDAKAPKVSLVSAHGKYLSSDNGKPVCNRALAKESEIWSLVDCDLGRVALRDHKGKYLSVEKEDNITTRVDKAKGWEWLVPTVRLSTEERITEGQIGKAVGFKGPNGKYLSAEKEGKVICNRDEMKEWETFVIERVIQWNPQSPVTIKTHHGKYLATEKEHVVATAAEARPSEAWFIVQLGVGKIALRDHLGKYLSVDPQGALSAKEPQAREFEALEIVAAPKSAAAGAAKSREDLEMPRSYEDLEKPKNLEGGQKYE